MASRRSIVTQRVALFLIVLGTPWVLAGQLLIDQYEDALGEVHYETLRDIEAAAGTDTISRVKVYERLGRKSQSIHQPLSRVYLLRAIELLDGRLGVDLLRYKIKVRLAKTYINGGSFADADSLLHECLPYFKEQQSDSMTASTLMYIGDMHYRLGELDLALRHMHESVEYFKLLSDPYAHGASLNWLGIIYNALEDYESVIMNLKPYVEDARTGKHKNRAANSMLLSLSSAYLALDSIDVAEDYAKRAFDYYFKLDSPRYWSQYYSHMFTIARSRGDLLAANGYADTLIAYAELMRNSDYLAYAYLEKYGAVSQCCPEEDAMSYLTLGTEYAEESGKPEELHSAYQHWAAVSKRRGDYRTAVRYKEKVDSLSELIFTKNMAAEIKKIETQKMAEQSKKELQLVQAQADLKEANLQKERRIKYGLIVFLALLSLLATAIYYLLRQRTRTSKDLADKNVIISKALETNKMLIKEVHHRVKNNLQVVSSLLSLQSRFVDDELAKEALAVGRSRVQSMSLLHQSLYQKDNVKHVDVKSYFENLADNLLSTYKVDPKRIVLEKDIDVIELDVDTVIPMGLITNELISNALKYAFTNVEYGVLRLRLKDVGDSILLEVSDNGSGIAFTQLPEKSTSLGMRLIKSFAEKLEAEVTISNTDGTRFSIVLQKDHLPSYE